MNENDCIGEIELWMNMTELMKMNYEFTIHDGELWMADEMNYIEFRVYNK